MIDVVLHLGTCFGWSATSSQHLDNLIGHKFARSLDLFMAGGPREDFAYFVEQRLRDSGSLHDVWLLSKILSHHQSGHIKSSLTIFVNAAYD